MESAEPREGLLRYADQSARMRMGEQMRKGRMRPKTGGFLVATDRQPEGSLVKVEEVSRDAAELGMQI